MRKPILFALLILILLALTGGMLLKGRRTAASPTVLTGSLQGGCYLITPTACKISVQPFAIEISPGQTLLSFRLFANGDVIYDFAASTSNAPSGHFTPSTVALDFAAHCGQTYTLELHALDTGDLDEVTIGETAPIICPAATFETFLPLIEQ